MKQINYTNAGGFPLSANTLKYMQEAYATLNALGALAGELAIIKGCIVNSLNVTNGVVYINGELLEFRGGVQTPFVVIVQEPTNEIFEDGNSKEVYLDRYAAFGQSGGVSYNWADFYRVNPLEVLEDMINTLKAKLDTIDENAKVQVPSDWSATTGVSRILNKDNVLTFLRKGVFVFGDVPAVDYSYTITFPAVANVPYIVVGSLLSGTGDYNNDNDVIWTTKSQSTTSFQLLLREVSSVAQDLRFLYILIPL